MTADVVLTCEICGRHFESADDFEFHVAEHEINRLPSLDLTHNDDRRFLRAGRIQADA